MNCPVCQRSLAPTLSICPTCGAMMNDTVREEVQKNITSGPITANNSGELVKPRKIERPMAVSGPAMQKKVNTAGLVAPKTSPTLVEFNHKNKSIPEWRLQLQNAVQQRKGGQGALAERQPLAVTESVRKKVPADTAETVEPIADPRVANAIRRITESRNTFLEQPPAPKRVSAVRPESSRAFGLVTGSAGAAVALDRTVAAPKPRLVNVSAPPVLKRDTNKLPRIELGGTISEGDEIRPIPADVSSRTDVEPAESKRIKIVVETNHADEPEVAVEDVDDIEDLAPLSMRFGAGLFDLMIGVFATMLILSPIAFAGIEWLSWGGLLTLTGAAAIVLFLYMTASLGFFGKTAGMKLFSLELVDAVDNEYPTIKQSAVNSSIFLLSLGLAGAGFISMLFNEEKRALHDLLSGTILVREF